MKNRHSVIIVLAFIAYAELKTGTITLTNNTNVDLAFVSGDMEQGILPKGKTWIYSKSGSAAKLVYWVPNGTSLYVVAPKGKNHTVIQTGTSASFNIDFQQSGSGDMDPLSYIGKGEKI